MLTSPIFHLALSTSSLLAMVISPANAIPSPLPMPLARLESRNAKASAASSSQPNKSIENYAHIARNAMSYPVDVDQLHARGSLGDTLASLSLGALSLRDMASSDETDEDYQHRAVGTLGDVQALLQDTHQFLLPLAQDKGEANLDTDVPVEVALKDVVNASKMSLKAVSKITDRLPIVGPLLGPIVYQLKCVLDDVLDFTENLTDGVINLPIIKPLILECLGSSRDYVCGPGGLDIAGLCLGNLLGGIGLVL